MKKVLAMILALALVISLAACGSGNQTADAGGGQEKAKTVKNIPESELLGDWVDINSFTTLTLSKSGDATMDTTSAFAPWTVKGSTIECVLFSPDYPNAKNTSDGILKTEEVGGALRLVNEKYCFMRFEDIPMTELAFGEKGTDDAIELELQAIEFTTEIPKTLANKISGMGAKEKTTLDDGLLYAAITYDLTNRSKKAFTIGDHNQLLRLVIEYGDGYLFSSEEKDPVYFTDGTNVAIHYDYSSINEIELQPLQRKTITTYLRCPEIVGKDSEEAIAINFISFCSENGVQYYKYTDVRDAVSITCPVSEDELPEILCAYKWRYENESNQGTMEFFADGTGILASGKFDFDMQWTHKGNRISQSYSYGGTDFAAELDLIYNNGVYELHNVSHPDVIWYIVE